MRFFRERNNSNPGCLWDPKTGRPVYTFTKGVCEVDDGDIETIAIMRSLGFAEAPISPHVQVALNVKHDAAMPPPPPAPVRVPDVEPVVKIKGVPHESNS